MSLEQFKIEEVLFQIMNKQGINDTSRCLRWAFGKNYKFWGRSELFATWNGKHYNKFILLDNTSILTAFSKICNAYKSHKHVLLLKKRRKK